jgi:hypothetical protein
LRSDAPQTNPTLTDASAPVVTAERSTRPRLRVRTALGVVFASVLTVVALVSCTPPGQSNAITGTNRPTPIAGATNGNLASSQLYTLNSNCQIYKPAAGSLAALIAAARYNGIALDTSECYRNYAGQVYQRNYWCGQGICANAATPGYSNHGWGKAVDFKVTNMPLNWTSFAYTWLTLNAGRFGFIHPDVVNEVWHWEWVGDGGQDHGDPVALDLRTWPMTQGANGTDVKSIQQSLNWWGANLTVDGAFGPLTGWWVGVFQSSHGLSVSGTVDLNTALKLGFH